YAEHDIGPSGAQGFFVLLATMATLGPCRAPQRQRLGPIALSTLLKPAQVGLSLAQGRSTPRHPSSSLFRKTRSNRLPREQLLRAMIQRLPIYAVGSFPPAT